MIQEIPVLIQRPPTALWKELCSETASLEKDWIQFARYTNPRLYPDTQTAMQNSVQITRSFQTVGPVVMENLVSQLASTMFPVDRPMFRYIIPEAIIKQAKAGTLQNKRGESLTYEFLIEVCTRLERESVTYFNQIGVTPSAPDFLRGAGTFGDHLIYLHEDTFDHHNIRNYRCRTTLDGELDLVVIWYPITRKQADVKQGIYRNTAPQTSSKVDAFITVVQREKVGDNKFEYVERKFINDTLLEPEIRYTKPRYFKYAWWLIKGDHYGYGHVDKYATLFDTLNATCRAIDDKNGQLADLINIVAPGSIAAKNIEALRSAPRGDYVVMNPGEISPYIPGTHFGMEYLLQYRATLSAELQQAFVYQPAMFRDAERVTAEELRLKANIFKATLGNVFSSLETTNTLFVNHYTERHGKELEAAGITPSIVTGTAALSRAYEADNVFNAVGSMAQLYNIPDQMWTRVRRNYVEDSIALGHGLSLEELFNNEEQTQAAQDKLQEQMMAAQLGGMSGPSQPTSG